MTSPRLLVHLGALTLIIGACAADNAGSGASGGATGNRTGGAPGTGGATGSGGATATGGVTATGGADATGGAANTGGAVGTGTGGQSSTGGAPGTAGAGTSGHIGGGGGSGGDNTGGTAPGNGEWVGYPLKNPPVPSSGCGKPATITSSKYPAYRTIMSSGDTRQYVIDLPIPYDMNTPYRFILASHGVGGQGNDIQKEHYYGIQDIPDAAKSTIFVSASGIGGAWGLKDVPLFDDLLAFVEANACVDKSRVFVTGFSYGGMYSYSLSITRQKSIRAGVGMAPVNYVIQIPTKSHYPIGWMQSTGVNDGMCPWVSNEAQMLGGKFVAIEHGMDNGCMVPNPIPTWTSGGILCDDFPGCKPGYPTRVCTFNGVHSLPFTSDHPATAKWIWDFLSQF